MAPIDPPTTTRNLGQDRMFGLLAVQLGFLTAESLRHHAHAFAKARPGTGFGAWLISEGILNHADVALLEACVAKGVQTHGNVQKALSALTVGAQAYTESFVGFDDTYQSGERGPVSMDSLEGLEFVVPEMAGRYTTTEELLGRGGLGRVLAYKDHVLGRTIAWKELHQARGGRELDTLASMQQEARFLREARLAAQLEHPSIVPVYEVGRRVDGSVYYTMRRIDGRTLADALDQAGSLDARLKLMPHLIATAQALAYAHSRDVLHRDVKPQNVMLGRFGETYLLDWGLAKVKVQADSHDAPSAPDITGGLQVGAVGTPSYMSPEQAAGKHDVIDQRTDVWGLGAMLYQVLTGRPPYVGDSPLECVQKILRDEVLPPKMVEAEAPNDLVAVCMKALSRSPSQRYASAGAMVEDLQAWLSGRTVSARQYSRSMRVWRFVRRNRLTVGLVSTLLVALVGTGGFFTWRNAVQRREARALSATVLRAFMRHLAYLPGSNSLVDDIAQPSLDYFRAQGSLSDGDNLLFGQTLRAMGGANFNMGRLKEASALFDECAARFPLEPRAMEEPEYRSVALGCVLNQADVLMLDGHIKDAEVQLSRVRAVLDQYGERDHDTRAWLRVVTDSWGRIARAAQNANRADEATLASEKEWQFDAVSLRANPKDPGVLSNHVSVSSGRALSIFVPARPTEALTVVEEGLRAARQIPRAFLLPRNLRSWLGLLETGAMMDGWAGHPERALTRLEEARPLYEHLIGIEPEEQQGRGIYADLLLDVGRPCEAKAVYDGLMASGAAGSYLVSQLLSALACDELTPFTVLTAKDLAENEDQQVHWLYALYQVRVGRVREGAEHLQQWADAASAGAQQWPKGVLDTVPERVPPAHRAAVEKFVRDSETLLNEESNAELPTFGVLARELRATLGEK